MTKGRQLPVNSKVRRRLFEDDPVPVQTAGPQGVDYLTRIIKREYEARNLKNELTLKGMKWNFDFENEVPLDGPIQWYRKGNGDEWVGMNPTGRIDNMRKRKMDPESAAKSTYADERTKVRKLPLHTVARRRSFIIDERSLECAKIQAADENFINIRMEEMSPELKEEVQYWNFDFQKRVPLKGPVEWQQAGGDWVGNVQGFDSRVILYFNSQVQKDGKTAEEVAESAKAGEEKIVTDEDAVEVNVLNKVTEHVKVVYGDRSKTNTEMPGGSGISELENIENLAIAERNMEVHVVRKNMLNEMIKAKNQATPKNNSKDSMPPAMKMKNLKPQVFGYKAKRRISFE